MEVFLGISAVEGTGIGSAFLIPDTVKRVIPQNQITKNDVSEGWERFKSAISSVKQEILLQLANISTENKANSVQKEILETYLLMLDDPVFLQEVQTEYEEKLFNIEYTIHTKAEEYASRLRNIGNEYLAERAQDITDIFGKVLNKMLGIVPFDINQVPDGSVIIATSLSPTDTIILSKRKIVGLALTEGGVSSHVVILAKNYGIPTIVGLNSASLKKKITNGEKIIIDGKAGELLADPEPEIMQEFIEKIREAEKHREALKQYLNEPAKTKDGVSFKLYANIGSPEEAEIAVAEGADGIGLFRTEFLYMSQTENSSTVTARSFSEDEQFEAYKHVLEVMKDKPVTIRTLDAGGDKLINSVELPKLEEKNPLMGLRAVRLSLAFPQIFKTQLRALYRASVYGNLQIMLPLITSTEQVIECLSIIEEVKSELDAKKIPFKKDVPVGIMIETAAAAITSDCLAKSCDFFSIGTNDLTQYTIGVDRENSKVSSLYDEFNLAVLRLIEMTISNATKVGIPLSVCGEMASRQDSILVLGGLGVRHLSMGPKMISEVKELLSRFSIKELESISSKRLNKL